MNENSTLKNRPEASNYYGILKLSPDIRIIISAIAALERDLIAERVKNGLRNARLKGKLLGRKKQRDSDLIRKLRKAGLSYRAVATIAKCSHGSVHAEILAWKKEEKLRLAQEQNQNNIKEPIDPESTVSFPILETKTK